MGRHAGNFRIRKERTTIVISGRDHFTWCGYAFGKLRSSVLDGRDKDASDSEDDDDPVPPPDLFVTGGCEAVVINSEDPVLDPRIYFLLCTQNRLEIVSQLYEYLVQKLEAGFGSWVDLTIDDWLLLLTGFLGTNSYQDSK
jgi:hypothetical protein